MVEVRTQRRDIKRFWSWCCFVWHVHIFKKLTVNTCANVRWEETKKDITELVSQAFPETTKGSRGISPRKTSMTSYRLKTSKVSSKAEIPAVDRSLPFHFQKQKKTLNFPKNFNKTSNLPQKKHLFGGEIFTSKPPSSATPSNLSVGSRCCGGLQACCRAHGEGPRWRGLNLEPKRWLGKRWMRTKYWCICIYIRYF